MYSKKILNCVDLGAGSHLQNKTSKSISEIVHAAAKPEKYAQLLFRLVNHFQPATILELGTSLGISSAYMASANSRSKLITIEGCKEIAAIAGQNFKKLELFNIEQLTGNFDDRLPEVLKKIDQLDFVFFDGNHRKIPTINYFEQCLEKASERSVFVFDDIYWSDEMKEAWQEIKNNDRVTVTIDLFYFGILFFRKEQVKEHFVIRY
jgi:predicted O-methyltransferase YrrM